MTKYGNVSVKTSVTKPNKFSVSMIVDSDELTWGESGVAEQISVELKFEVELHDNYHKTFNLLASAIESVLKTTVVAIIVYALISLVLYLGASIAGLLSAFAALLLFVLTQK